MECLKQVVEDYPESIAEQETAFRTMTRRSRGDLLQVEEDARREPAGYGTGGDGNRRLAVDRTTGYIRMTTHLSRHFRKIRMEKGLRLGARRPDARATGTSPRAQRRVDTFETTGNIKEQLFKKLAAVLEIDQATVNGLLQKDLEDWTRWANEPIKPYLVVRLIPAFYTQGELPDEVRSVEDAERYASGFAKERRLQVCLVLSRRVSVYYAEDGTFRYASEAVPGGGPNEPCMRIGGRPCRARILDHGIALSAGRVVQATSAERGRVK